MRSDPLGIPAGLDHLEEQHQPPPVPQEMKEERCYVWNRYIPEYLRERPCTLVEMEVFLAEARDRGAPDDALLFAMPALVRVGWYAKEADTRARRIAQAHDVMMPHDVRKDAGTVEGCPPNCPARQVT